jgi:hypothetical protein
MKFYMTGQEKVTFKYSELLNRGDLMGRFDCIYKKYLIQHGILSRYRCDILYGCSLL